MHDFIRRAQQHQVGHEVLIGTRYTIQRNGFSYVAQFAFATVKSDDGRTMILEDEAGVERLLVKPDFSDIQQEKGTGARVLWSVDLPHGDQEARRNFCQTMLDAGRPMMILVTSKDDAAILGRIVMDGPIAPEAIEETDALPPIAGIDTRVAYAFEAGLSISRKAYALDLSRRGRNVLMRHEQYEQSTGEPVEGTLIVARDFSCRMDEGGRPIISLVDWERVAEFQDPTALNDFLPRPSQDVLKPMHFPPPVNRFGDDDQIQREMDLAAHATLPDEALILTDSNSDVLSVVSFRGALLNSWTEAIDYFDNQSPGAGLFVAENFKCWSHESQGEYDTGIDADWRPATMEDLSRHELDLDALDAEIHEYLEDDSEIAGTTARQMALAETATVAVPVP